MTTVYAQGAVEYVGVAGGAAGAGASSAIAVIGEVFDAVYIAVNHSVSDHPVLWAAGLCVTLWLLLRAR